MSKQVPLSNSPLTFEVDDWNYPKVINKIWCADLRGGKVHSIFTGKIGSRCKSITRFLTGKKLIDHIDRNPLNNKENNFRQSTHQQNCFNASKQSNCSSKYKGVCWDKSRNLWQGRIYKSGKTYMKRFDSELQAALYYDSMARILFGRFSNCNFIIT